MKTRILMIALMLIIGIVGFVIAEISDYNIKTANIDIQKGWNLVPLIYDYHIISENSDIKLQDIEVAYMYSPIEGKYVKYIEKGEILGKKTSSFWTSEEEITKIITQKQSLITSEADSRNIMFGMSSWIYTRKSGNLKINVGYDTKGNKILVSGWNFLAITPEMVGKTLGELKGGCDITKSYAWWVERQTWDLIDLNDAPFSDNLLGRGIIVKVSNDCAFGESIVSPPVIPA